MSCAICANLERAYEAGLREYIEACCSASYGFSTKFAARKNVDMERARYELEEHRSVCAFAAGPPALPPEREVPKTSRQVAA
jgi:hypothetical protein